MIPTFLVVTSVSKPTKAMRKIAERAILNKVAFLCVGDRKSPENYELPGCKFISLNEQLETGFELAGLCLENHYARKNIGYLMAIRAGAEKIVETDDDNNPLSSFWEQKSIQLEGRFIEDAGWSNPYSYFSDEVIWPRGFPLEYIQSIRERKSHRTSKLVCPVQQGLANGDPDVDAVFRLTRALPFTFDNNVPIILGNNCWSPFNSQNTIWWRTAFPLMYLPSYCSFRMTDIWRSFVAQACMWANGWHVAFLAPTVFQERNKHNLLRDFEEEIPGYLNNDYIVKALMKLHLKPGEKNLFKNLKKCYSVFIEAGLIKQQEIKLLNAWQQDLSKAGIAI
jgi:hypothetical protein